MEEIVGFLNRQTNGKVDTSLAEQIFNELDDDGSGHINLNEFIGNYFEKQREVKELIISLEEQVKIYSQNREKILAKLKEQKQKERLNSYGLDDDAALSIRVVEARDLMPMDYTGKSDPYCILKFGK